MLKLKLLLLSLLASLGIYGPPKVDIPPPIQERAGDTVPLQEEVPEEEATSTPVDEIRVEIGGDDYDYSCSCVPFVRTMSGFTFPKVRYAKDIVVNRILPQVGSAVIFKAVPPYGEFGHVAYITSVSTSTFQIIEKNLTPCEVTKRTIKITDPAIKGFFNNRF